MSVRRLLVPALVLIGACARGPQTYPLEWAHTAQSDHPLVGRVWSRRAQDWVVPGQLQRAVAEAPVLLLGETHHNADHHQLQAQLLARWLGDGGQAHTVAFEMLDERQGELLEVHAPTTPQQLSAVVAWQHSGWPDFVLYQPVFRTVLAAGAQPAAAHPNRDVVKASMMGGEAALSEQELQALHLDDPLPEAARASLHEEIVQAHCGHAHASMVEPMAAAQKLKDAWMARALQRAAEQGPVALIAGAGHVREDRGVPFFMARRGEPSALTVAMLEVREGAERAEDYELAQHVDYVVFTPRVSNEDPCDKFRRQLQQMGEGHWGQQSPER